jgi:predicted lipoprotein with Yx(FWY)xxD motif
MGAASVVAAADNMSKKSDWEMVMAGRLKVLAVVLAATVPVVAAWAQPTDIPLPAATTTEFPAGISVANVPSGKVYVDAQGRTLYGMDMRMVVRWSIDTTKYCQDRCPEWEPLLAPAGTKPNLSTLRYRPGAPRAGTPSVRGTYSQTDAPDWTVVDGPAGPQYVYKGYNMVYVRKGDKPRSTQFEGADGQIWNTLKFIPPVPKLTAPGGVGSVFAKDAYLLTDKDGRLLYTGRCGKDCVGWEPLAAGAASQGLGDWTVDRTGDRPQWLYRGKSVFVASDDNLDNLPRATVALRP